MQILLRKHDISSIIHDAVHDDWAIDDEDNYQEFMTDIAEVITKYFGGDCITVAVNDQDEFTSVRIDFDDETDIPPNGGIYKHYGTIINQT